MLSAFPISRFPYHDSDAPFSVNDSCGICEYRLFVLFHNTSMVLCSYCSCQCAWKGLSISDFPLSEKIFPTSKMLGSVTVFVYHCKTMSRYHRSCHEPP